MKKIVVVFDGLRFSDSTLRYAIAVARQQPAHLVGLFLDDFTYNSFGMYQLLRSGTTNTEIRELEAKDERIREISARNFEQACQEAGLNYSVHHDRNIAIQEILRESIYADLLIIDMDETLVTEEAKPPTRFIRDLLIDVQCPVILVPPKYQEIKKLVLLYDGEPSSVYAIKMFSYLMPGLQQLQTAIISVNDPGDGMHLPDNRLMKEFIKRHYPEAEYVILKGNAEDEIIRYLHREKKDPLIALGAYRRSKLSRLFKPSMADYMLQHLKMPLFIAHNKS